MFFDPSRKHAVGALGVVFVIAVAGSPAPTRADPLVVTRWTVDGGGAGFGVSGSFVTAGTIGQPDAGLLAGVGFAVAGGFWIPGISTPVAVDDGGSRPGAETYTLAIHPASPNPMQSRTTIRFELPDEREALVQVFDLRGALQRTVASGRFAPGVHRFDWDGRGADGHRVGAGMYLVRLRLGPLERSQKLVVLR
jgi:hypothetical protein